MTNESPFEMSISLNVLNHLGIGLYSNIPAVLSEIVANAWDADATRVDIDINIQDGTIIIKDNGVGMTLEDINNKYLMVGYTKRTVEPGKTKKGRNPMGRKGIGKLSVFSIADIVEVHTAKDGIRNGLIMKVEDIKTMIADGSTHKYRPQQADQSVIQVQQGTWIILRQVNKGLLRTAEFLKKRLARRFSVIGEKFDFHVFVDGKEISALDRDFMNSIEFFWYFDEDSNTLSLPYKNIERRVKLDNKIEFEGKDYYIKGWIGTVDEQKNIDDVNNTIIVFAHGKLIQEDILADFKEGGVYAEYIIGEVEADFMDLDTQEDIVTSDRQRVKEDDPRYTLLKKRLLECLKLIQSQWTNLRNELGLNRALKNDIIRQWYDHLQGDNKKYAGKLFGKIESLKIKDVDAKKEIYKASLMAFEKLALRNSLSILDSLQSNADFDLITKIFDSIDEIESAHYYQIIKGRINVIKEFENLLPQSKERVLQQHIFDHIWLLDASWERAASNMRIEQSVTKEFQQINANLTADEKDGRIDIRYKTAAGKHIIIELKKYGRKVTVYELIEQVRKYRNALEKCLRTQYPDETRVIECICIIGSPPEPVDQEQENINMLRTINARYITYDTLIQQTLKSYEEYLISEKNISNLIRLIESLDNPPNNPGGNSASSPT